ncbi:hypothetical protein MPOCJGCO_0221 [Methylobacterium trifolii]|uniref:Hemin uptake protein HemP n=1 Tax=Methylobacterium trifolii TaxID=1003092 RepID=A0ABQ4TTY2_9HYPH|nr:hypothetical protein MPOCJGCO_0221 [Methylobacterium trifolii]
MSRQGDDERSEDLRARSRAGERIAQTEAVIASNALMNGRREVVILHAGERYRLRVTANDKLILTK